MLIDRKKIVFDNTVDYQNKLNEFETKLNNLIKEYEKNKVYIIYKPEKSISGSLPLLYYVQVKFEDDTYKTLKIKIIQQLYNQIANITKECKIDDRLNYIILLSHKEMQPKETYLGYWEDEFVFAEVMYKKDYERYYEWYMKKDCLGRLSIIYTVGIEDADDVILDWLSFS